MRRLIEMVFGEEEIFQATIPMKPTWNVEYQSDAARCDQDKWATVLGLAVYVSRIKPDILVAMSLLCSRTQEATERDWDALVFMVAYLAFTESIGLTFHPNDEEDGRISSSRCMRMRHICSMKICNHILV